MNEMTKLELVRAGFLLAFGAMLLWLGGTFVIAFVDAFLTGVANG